MPDYTPSGWKPKKLNELGFVGRGRSKHRPRNDPSLYGGPYPFVQTGDVKEAEFYLTHFSQTYNDKGLVQSKLWDAGTLCITIAANIAETAILGIRACFPDSIVGFQAYPDVADVRFVKYYIDTIKFNMQNISKGTTQDNLSVDKLLRFDIWTPPLPTQRKIASILSAYDDLIENNTRRIKLLEEMAQSLYREWFVHFRFPGHEGVRLVESELGLVPEGWGVKRLGDVLELAYGKALKTDTRVSGPIPVYGSSGVAGWHHTHLVPGPGIIVGRKGNVGTVFWSSSDFYPIDTVFYVRTQIPLHYIFYNLREQHFINNDAAVPGLNRNQAYLNRFILPDVTVLNMYQRFIKPIFEQLDILRDKNANLRRTRDLLLPKLISGEVEVSPVAQPLSEGELLN
ncbi:MAG TPA: restriction endonuclease subunit S [Chloroflexia bacterium]|nr:restriction endonuclease subunit S [Chloroflexia bacterium]